MSDERSDVSTRAEGPTHEELISALRELRSRATLLEILCRALAPLAYQWAALVLVAAAWFGILFVAELATPRLVGGVLFSIFAGGYAFLVQHRKGTT